MGVRKKRHNHLISALLLATGVLAGSLLFGTAAHAAGFESLEPDWNDPEYIKMVEARENREEEELDASWKVAGWEEGDEVDPYTGKVYDHGIKSAGYDILHGVDVSKWHQDANWRRIKEDGMTFAFLRIGYSGTNDGLRYEDPCFDLGDEREISHYRAAKAQGLKVGVYYFSQAITVKEAKKEAEFTLKLLDGKELDLPVVFDYESGVSTYRNHNLTKEEGTAICKAFCDVIRAAGYNTMIYADFNYMTNKIDASQLAADNSFWLARYNTRTGYSGAYEFWQYTDKGCVDGIGEDADVNFWYVPSGSVDISNPNAGFGQGPVAPEPELPEDPEDGFGGNTTQIPVVLNGEPVNTSAVTLNWEEFEAAEGYQLLRSDCLKDGYEEIADLKADSYLDEGLTEGREYYYMIRAYKLVDGEKVYEEFSDVLSVQVPFARDYRLLITGKSLNVRRQAGTEYSAIGGVEKDMVVSLVGFTNAVDGEMWYRIRCVDVRGKFVEGYVSGAYAKPYIPKITGVQGTPDSTTALTISWTPQEGVTSYQIYRADTVKGTFSRVATVNGSKTSYKNTKLTKCGQYLYKVRAYVNVNGKKTYGKYSDVVVLGAKGTNKKVKTTVATKMYSISGSSFKNLTTVPKGISLKATHNITDLNGNLWYYCTGKVNGKSVTGYVLVKDLKVVK